MKLVIEINGEDVTIEMKEAKRIFSELSEIFDKPSIGTLIREPIHIDDIAQKRSGFKDHFKWEQHIN